MADEEEPTPEYKPPEGVEADAPLSDIAERVAERTTTSEEGTFDEPFAQQPFHELDPEAIWTENLEKESAVVRDLDGITREDEETFIVPKRDFCESCEFLSEPPTVECDHDGTTIHEFVDIDHVRVRNCPVVANLLRLTR